MEELETTDVVIVGCGPTGAMLSTLLGRYGISNVVLEREPDITTDPRGIALDEDGIRCLQACGIYDKIFTDIGQCTGGLKFIGGAHNDLYRKEFLNMNHGTTEGGTGHPGFMFHKQPSIEKHLRSCINASATSDLRVSSTLQSIREDKDWVYAAYSGTTGQTHSIRSKFLVGCDGKTGFTRKNYLEPLGISLERAHRMSYEEIWVALNWKISLPTPGTHPDFPLWVKGYTPEQVYDLFFPVDFRFLCHPKRAAVCGRFGLKEDRLWRFEFVVLDGEDGTEMAREEKIKKVVWPYITHPGERYGLKGTVKYPDDCIQVLRCRPFKFSARSCNKWALGRVVLCGDAAHVFPPFGGQGIASGFRDAIALAWRLVIATGAMRDGVSGWTLDFSKLLLGWYAERKQSLDRSLASTVENGNYVTQSDPIRILVRDWSLWVMQLIPSWKHWLELGDRREGMVRYKWEPGKSMVFLPNMGGGGNFPQVYCKRVDGIQENEKVQFTDDVIFADGKKGMFQLVVLLNSGSELEDARNAIRRIIEADADILRADEVTFVLQSTDSPSVGAGDGSVYRLATAEEFAQEEVLCTGRPPPLFYDPLRMLKEVDGKRYVIVRPDRFIFAATSSRQELDEAARQLFLSFTVLN